MSLFVRLMEIPAVILVTPKRHLDTRGHFVETWSKRAFNTIGIDAEFVQDNESLSALAGTLRGLHFQRPPFEQAKLVRVIRGSIFDVAVDLRPGSSSFGRWCAATMTGDKHEEMFVPRGFAHGFLTLEPNTIVAYKVDAPYSPEHEAGIRWDDPALQIPWPKVSDEISISPKDLDLPLLESIGR